MKLELDRPHSSLPIKANDYNLQGALGCIAGHRRAKALGNRNTTLSLVGFFDVF